MKKSITTVPIIAHLLTLHVLVSVRVTTNKAFTDVHVKWVVHWVARASVFARIPQPDLQQSQLHRQ